MAGDLDALERDEGVFAAAAARGVGIRLRVTARETGDGSFRALVRVLGFALGTLGARVTEYDPATRRLRALAFHLGGRFIAWEAPIDGTPCARVTEEARLDDLAPAPRSGGRAGQLARRTRAAARARRSTPECSSGVGVRRSRK